MGRSLAEGQILAYAVREPGPWKLDSSAYRSENVSHTGRYVWFLPRETRMARVIQNILLLKISVTVEPCKLSLLQLRLGDQAVLAGSHSRSEKTIFSRENGGQKPGRGSDSGIRSQGIWTLETGPV